MGLSYPRLCSAPLDGLAPEQVAPVATAVEFAELAGTAMGALVGGGVYSLADGLGVTRADRDRHRLRATRRLGGARGGAGRAVRVRRSVRRCQPGLERGHVQVGRAGTSDRGPASVSRTSSATAQLRYFFESLGTTNHGASSVSVRSSTAWNVSW